MRKSEAGGNVTQKIEILMFEVEVVKGRYMMDVAASSCAGEVGIFGSLIL